jgi:hypothetical protein
LVLVFKISDNSPACVKPDTAQKLMQRGWGILNSTLSASKSNLTNTSDQKSYAHFIVLRLGNDTEIIGYSSTIHKIDYQVIARHPELLNGIQAEDERVNNLEVYCQHYQYVCNSLQPHPYMGHYETYVDHATVRSMLDDTDLHFRTSPSLPASFKETQIDINGIVYSTGFQCSVDGCK